MIWLTNVVPIMERGIDHVQSSWPWQSATVLSTQLSLTVPFGAMVVGLAVSESVSGDTVDATELVSEAGSLLR